MSFDRTDPRGARARPGFTRWLVILAAMALFALAPVLPGAVLDKDRALAAQTFWDNRDGDWFKANIPFFECPDAELVTTYYYRWELVTKHLTYGSPTSGYSFTEFIDRPFWSGAYGSISCPAGHQLYEVRWLRDPRYARDYARYWFRTPGAQPRNYGCWIPDGVWAAHVVHPEEAFVKDLLPDLMKNYEAWTKRQFVPEIGLFWQNGHDDGMEFNINSRQTQDILRGANGYRPGFNAYMYADALAIARIARLAGQAATARDYEARAVALKENIQKLLWDPNRDFFFPMSMREEKDKEGHVVGKQTLTYQTGQFAGSPHGREEHGYVPWQFNLPDPGHESAWRFLVDRDYFFADHGPTTVERHDPLFLLQESCCWWSGQSWPYATAQTLKALANLLQNYEQKIISRSDYVKLLRVFSLSHRKDGRPYLAEALHPDTGSFAGHDGYNHSEHYFHSSFNDLIITGLIGLKTRADDVLELDPLAPPDWDYFALEDVAYRGRQLTILWDRDGKRYGKGAGLRVWAATPEVPAGGLPPGLHEIKGWKLEEIAATNRLAKIIATLPGRGSPMGVRWSRLNFAVNNDGDYFPRFRASFTDPKTPLHQVNDGNYWYTIHPPNRWTTRGSTNATDWLELDLGTPRPLHNVTLYFLDDSTNILAPRQYELEFHDGKTWQPVPNQSRTPSQPTGHRANIIVFPEQAMSRVRAVFTHTQGGFTGLTEFEAWGADALPYTPAPPPSGNLAMNAKGQGFPKASASFSDRFGGVASAAIDGRVNYRPTPINRWTSFGSSNATDWLEIDFGGSREMGRVDLHLYDDRGGVQAPARYSVQYYAEGEWRDAAGQTFVPAAPAGSALNTVTFAKVSASRLRVVFTHQGRARSGVTELEVWKE